MAPKFGLEKVISAPPEITKSHTQLSFYLRLGEGVRYKPLAAYHKKLPLIPNSQKNDVLAQWGAIYAPHASLEKCQLSIFSSIWPIFKIYIPAHHRCEILCWFQKCIPLYTYLADFLSYGHPKAEKGPVWGKRAFFGLKLTITLEICNISIQKYTFLKST